jgi:steroid delta-isomerase-like uncharacterized protein
MTMKVVQMSFWPILGLFASSLVTDAAGAGPDEEHLKAAVTSMFEQGWNRGEVEVFSSSIAETVDFHYAGSPQVVSREEMGAIVLRWRDAFPDLRMAIDELIAEGNLVAARLTLSGTHEGPWRGAAPTGKSVTMALMMFFRFEDGKLVELWESDDQLGFRRQLKMLP